MEMDLLGKKKFVQGYQLIQKHLIQYIVPMLLIFKGVNG